jgi:hypothetical protein
MSDADALAYAYSYGIILFIGMILLVITGVLEYFFLYRPISREIRASVNSLWQRVALRMGVVVLLVMIAPLCLYYFVAVLAILLRVVGILI